MQEKINHCFCASEGVWDAKVCSAAQHACSRACCAASWEPSRLPGEEAMAQRDRPRAVKHGEALSQDQNPALRTEGTGR